jgi:uncharacterized membrane protein YgaE (UPF0421/DUF939 family)
VKIGYRTIKTAIGAPVAISIAQLLGLTNFVSAGILTILCIQPSRKKSVLSAWHRFAACVLATIFSFLFFETIGYHPVVVGLMLALFIPTTVLLKVTPGIATSSVIFLNLYSAEYMSYTFLFDQFLVILVGVGVGLLLNLYMPSLDKQLKEKQEKLEQNFQIILYEIALYIQDKNENWTGKELTKSEEILDEALELVDLDKENHLLRDKHPYYDYFTMRAQQLELLGQMLPLVSRLPDKDRISEEIADFFIQLSEAVHPGNTAIFYLNKLTELKKQFNSEELPATQEEFETKANLFRLLHEIEDYLNVKRKFKASDVSMIKKQKRADLSE